MLAVSGVAGGAGLDLIAGPGDFKAAAGGKRRWLAANRCDPIGVNNFLLQA